MTTSKIETLTDEERELLSSLEKGWTANKALRIIDAHAAERAALTEQVAQLTRERDEARALHEQALNERDEAHKALELDCWNRSHDAEYEVARLTEQVAQLTAALENIALGTVHPAEREVARLTEQVAQLLSQLPDGMQHCTIRFVACEVGHGRLTATNWIDHGCDHCKLTARDRQYETAFRERAEAESEVARLRAENARLTEALAAAERRGAHFDEQCAANLARAEAAERDRDAANALLQRALPQVVTPPLGNEQLQDDIRAHLSGQPAAPARTTKREADDCAHQMAAAPATTAAEARVRELEAENTTMWRFSVASNIMHYLGNGQSTACGQWSAHHAEATGNVAEVTCKRCLLTRYFCDALAAQGLHVVTAADKAVLDAARAMTIKRERSTRPPFTETVVGRGGGQALIEAEFARRSAK